MSENSKNENEAIWSFKCCDKTQIIERGSQLHSITQPQITKRFLLLLSRSHHCRLMALTLVTQALQYDSHSHYICIALWWTAKGLAAANWLILRLSSVIPEYHKHEKYIFAEQVKCHDKFKFQLPKRILNGITHENRTKKQTKNSKFITFVSIRFAGLLIHAIITVIKNL